MLIKVLANIGKWLIKILMNMYVIKFTAKPFH